MKDRWLHKIIDAARAIAIPRNGQRRPSFFICMILGYLFLSMAFSGSTLPAFGAERSSVPSYGKGPKELIVFTDYFCPPCMTMEADLEPAINKLLTRGDVKVTFVDMPLHKLTPLYAKYFLFATQGAASYKNAMHARNVLFTLSKQNLAKTEAEIEKAFTEQSVAFMPFDPKPVYSEWNQIMKTHKITTTPTCILIYSATDIRKYGGTIEIRNGLLPELEAMEKKSKL
jgi:thiol-disulfide isomerase/thioredoxin